MIVKVFERLLYFYGAYTVEFIKRVAGHVEKGGITGAAIERSEAVVLAPVPV